VLPLARKAIGDERVHRRDPQRSVGLHHRTTAQTISVRVGAPSTSATRCRARRRVRRRVGCLSRLHRTSSRSASSRSSSMESLTVQLSPHLAADLQRVGRLRAGRCRRGSEDVDRHERAGLDRVLEERPERGEGSGRIAPDTRARTRRDRRSRRSGNRPASGAAYRACLILTRAIGEAGRLEPRQPISDDDDERVQTTHHRHPE
jgi:hypothetical protein